MSAKAQVVEKLERWSQRGGPLDFRGPNSSKRLFAMDSRRDLVLERVRDRYLARQDDISLDGRCAVVTAGPPAAGKSTLVDGLGLGFRVIDPDLIKDLLIQEALTDGTYDPLLALELAAGEPLHPRELSGLVHAESTAVAEDVMEVAMSRGENFILEGTLQWEQQGDRLLEVFEDHDYREVTILSCDVPVTIAQERALERWWTARVAVADGLGGRFVPAWVIAELYPKTDDSSRCRENADDMFEHARGRFGEVVIKTMDSSGTDERRHTSSRPGS